MEIQDTHPSGNPLCFHIRNANTEFSYWHLRPNVSLLCMHSLLFPLVINVCHLQIYGAWYSVWDSNLRGKYFLQLHGWKSAEQEGSVLAGGPEDEGDTFSRNISEHTYYMELYHRLWQYLEIPLWELEILHTLMLRVQSGNKGDSHPAAKDSVVDCTWIILYLHDLHCQDKPYISKDQWACGLCSSSGILNN